MSTRRDFITFLGTAAAAWPVVARAQQPAVPVVGFLHGSSAWESTFFVAAFRQGLGESGYVEGSKVIIDYRWAEGHYDRLPVLAADLVRRGVTAIVGNTPATMAAKAVTTTIPIVFSTGSDPVKLGFVASLNRPGRNVTGVSFFSTELEAKRLGILHELVPTATKIAAILNPRYPDVEAQLKEVQDAAGALGLQVQILHASSERDLDTAFATLTDWRAEAALVCADPFLFSRRENIVALASRYAVPAIYEQRENALAGGLASYGTNLTNAYHQVGIYTGRILKGEKPADLPVMQSTRFEFVINLKTAKALGLEIPPTLLARADEVIE